MKCAIATVAIGEDYQSSYTSIFKPSVQRYVDRYKYDLFVFNDYIGDREHRDPHLVTFMKMLVPYHEAVRGHDLLMVLDVDILIGAKAPPFHALDIGSKIGVVDEWCQPTREERVKFQVANGLETSASDYYHLAGFALESEILINSGMFICAPRKHAAFFREIVASPHRDAAWPPAGHSLRTSHVWLRAADERPRTSSSHCVELPLAASSAHGQTERAGGDRCPRAMVRSPTIPRGVRR